MQCFCVASLMLLRVWVIKDREIHARSTVGAARHLTTLLLELASFLRNKKQEVHPVFEQTNALGQTSYVSTLLF